MESLVSVKTESWLSWFLRGILVLGILVLFAKLFEIQIIKGGYFRSLANENRVKRIPISAPRGRILARGGEVLVGNIQTKKEVEGVSVDDWKRDYKIGSAFAHAGGYLGEVSNDEVGKVDPNCISNGPFKLGDLIGKEGLEKEYNCTLKGSDGEELIEVDASGKMVRILGTRNPIPGADLKTTIDIGLQEKVAQAFENAKDLPPGRKGAAVITDTNGEILAFYSSPSFNPNDIGSSLTDPNLPLFNRVISGTYHPGSVFKPIVAISGLEDGKINAGYIYSDPGVITINKFSYYNWYFSQDGRTEGNINLVRAITRSTDTFFYNLGEMVGPNEIARWATKFGLGQKTGIDLPGETQGLIPTPDWKEKVKGESWYLGNTYHYSIGQGDIAITPMAINSAIAVIAQNGKLCTPHLSEGNEKCHDIGINKNNLDLVKKGMVGACSQGGTGYTFFDFGEKHQGLQVACKTGTAETSLEGSPHAWFTLFAPSDFPEIVATVLVEKGGEGSKIAGPIARDIMDYWTEKRL